MLHGDGAVRQNSDLLLEGVLVLGQRCLLFVGILVGLSTLGVLLGLATLSILLRVLVRLAIVIALFLKTLVGLLQEGDMVVERLEVDRSVDVQVAVVLDDVAERSAVVELRTTQP